MVRRLLPQRHAQEPPQAQRIRHSPGDAPLRTDPLQVAHHQAAEVDARRQAGPAHRRGVKRLTDFLHPGIKPMRRQEPVDRLVVGMSRRLRQVFRDDEQRRLRLGLAFAHGHDESSVT